MVLHALGQFLIGVQDTPLGGDWRDYFRLCVVHREVAAVSTLDVGSKKLARAYQDSQNRSRWADQDAAAGSGGWQFCWHTSP